MHFAGPFGGIKMIAIDRLLDTACKKNAAELRLEPGRPARIYTDGTFRDIDTQTLNNDDLNALIRALTPDVKQSEFAAKRQATFGITHRDAADMQVVLLVRNANPVMIVRPMLH